MKGPQYDWPDLAYWGGMILGTSITVTAMRQAGLGNGILQLIAGIAVGVGVGFVAERMVRTAGTRPPGDGGDQGGAGPPGWT